MSVHLQGCFDSELKGHMVDCKSSVTLVLVKIVWRSQFGFEPRLFRLLHVELDIR